MRQIQGIHLDTLNWLYANLHLPGMSDKKYDELQKYLAEGQYHAGASKSDKYVLRQLAKNFQYDPATAVIYYIDKKGQKRIVIRGDDEKRRIFNECHGSPFGGHAGRDNTIFKIKERYYWPGFYSETAEMVSWLCDTFFNAFVFICFYTA